MVLRVGTDCVRVLWGRARKQKKTSQMMGDRSRVKRECGTYAKDAVRRIEFEKVGGDPNSGARAAAVILNERARIATKLREDR